MSKASFVVAFEGPGVESGTIDVRDLAPALLSIGQAVDAANRVINGEEIPARVQARAVSQGCFEVSLDVVLPTWETIRGMLLSEDAQAAANLLALLGFIGVPSISAGLIFLYRKLNGRNPDRIVRRGSEVILTIEDEQLTVPMEVLRLYRDIAVNQAIGKLLTTLEPNRVERIEFRRAPGLPPDQVLTKEDKKAFSLPEPRDETVVDETRKMALSIRSLAFQEANKWRLYDGQNTITATIDDKEFLGRVDRNEARFATGDILICEVRTIQRQGNEGLKTEHTVIRVLEHKHAPTQINLFE
jgi:hypothetical protein